MRTISLISLFLLTLTTKAQNAAPSWLEESLYGNGKINAVVAVVAMIILGIGIWMCRMDRKLTRMEKKVNASGN